MPELQVCLDFSCCLCDRPVGVTLKCAGSGLLGGLRSVAAVQVPCPNCNSVNQVYFEPCGIVRDVVPSSTRGRPALEPSIN